eukprot:SAG31_NODE_2093_length_6459_cov_3.398585_3_plen_494_part_00
MRGALLGALLVFLLTMGCGAAEQDLSAVFKRLDSLDQQLHQERQDKAALRAELADERRANLLQARQIAVLQAALHEFTNKTEARLNQCEAGTHPFIGEMERRRMQDEETLCRGSGLTAMFAACCPSGSGGGHRRFLQHAQGCDVLPDTCPSACAPLFIEFYNGCQDMVSGLTPAEQQEFAGLYSDCNEVEQQSAMANMQPVEVKMFRITIDQEAEQQAAMANGGSAEPSPPFGPVVLPPSGSVPASSPEDGAAIDVEQYHAQCTTANILSCVPACNATHHGFELLATIDGTDTKLSCNLANQQYSWVGAAALGGFLGSDVAAFVSAVISGAAGTYVLTLTEDADVETDLVVQPGQNVIINGDPGLMEGPNWGTGAFTVREGGTLSLTHIELTWSSGSPSGGGGSGTASSVTEVVSVSGGSLSLAQMAVTPPQLLALFATTTAAGSVVQVSELTVPGHADVLTGSLSVGVDGAMVYDPANLVLLVRFPTILLLC